MGDRLTFLGHSTVLVDLDGARLLTDPLLGHLAAGAIRRQVPPVLGHTLGDLSAVFISHGHWDHLDLASLRALPGEPAVIVPVAVHVRPTRVPPLAEPLHWVMAALVVVAGKGSHLIVWPTMPLAPEPTH